MHVLYNLRIKEIKILNNDQQVINGLSNDYLNCLLDPLSTMFYLVKKDVQFTYDYKNWFLNSKKMLPYSKQKRLLLSKLNKALNRRVLL